MKISVSVVERQSLGLNMQWPQLVIRAKRAAIPTPRSPGSMSIEMLRDGIALIIHGHVAVAYIKSQSRIGPVLRYGPDQHKGENDENLLAY